MITSRIRWDESMAVRCLEKCNDYYTPGVNLSRRVKSHKAVTAKALPVKAPPVKAPPVEVPLLEVPLAEVLSLDIAAGEWEGFEYALNSALKKKHK